jgi:hypothetical protein
MTLPLTQYVPDEGFAPGEETAAGGAIAPELPPFEILKRLPGAQEWAFQCMQLSSVVGANAAINNTTAGVSANYQMLGGLEGLIDWLSLGPNMIPNSGASATWLAAIKLNNVAIPGWGVVGQLKATTQLGYWWADVSIYVKENSLVQLFQVSASIGTVDIGGYVHGWAWPIRSRMAWEQAHPQKIVGA